MDVGLAEKKYEVIGGQVYDMSPSPNYYHGIIQDNIMKKLNDGLKDSICRVFYGNLDYKYNEHSEDYVIPDIMICCDRNKVKGSAYYGTPKFIVEILSPSTSKKDITVKTDVYQNAGVPEYWTVSPKEHLITVYYLVDGKYVIHDVVVYEDDESMEGVNPDEEITLREFPITMTLSEIFDTDW